MHHQHLPRRGSWVSKQLQAATALMLGVGGGCMHASTHLSAVTRRRSARADLLGRSYSVFLADECGRALSATPLLSPMSPALVHILVRVSPARCPLLITHSAAPYVCTLPHRNYACPRLRSTFRTYLGRVLSLHPSIHSHRCMCTHASS